MSLKKETWEWTKALLIALFCAGLIRYFLFAPIVVDGESMMPTLHNHDRLIINKVAYKIGKPHRFNIIVFHDHATDGKDFIKRVIGLPGDHIVYRHDTLYVNGKAVPEPYLKALKKKTNGNLTYDFSTTVPKGDLFVMGDNRRYSKDSRIIGPVPINKVIGKVDLQFWPLSHFHIVH